jgi:hypothetical protein
MRIADRDSDGASRSTKPVQCDHSGQAAEQVTADESESTNSVIATSVKLPMSDTIAGKP